MRRTGTGQNHVVGVLIQFNRFKPNLSAFSDPRVSGQTGSKMLLEAIGKETHMKLRATTRATGWSPLEKQN